MLSVSFPFLTNLFQHTATRRWLLLVQSKAQPINGFNTQPPEGGCALFSSPLALSVIVSTHSHPKVAAYTHFEQHQERDSFNTQPPEGGCLHLVGCCSSFARFNTQPPEGGCDLCDSGAYEFSQVSTHSHPKVAADYDLPHQIRPQCFNTQPPEGGCIDRTFD